MRFHVSSITTAFLIVGPAFAAEHPNMFLNQSEVEAIKARLSQSPWSEAKKGMIVKAERALELPAQSVTFQGNSGNTYLTERPYLTDGIFNPKADRADYKAAQLVSYAVRDLGIAYAFTGDGKYADKAISLIDAWCLHPKTGMKPQFSNSQSHIEHSVTMPGIFYGADMMWNYSGWKAADRSAFKKWAQAFANHVRKVNTSTNTNNFGSWRMVLLASAAVVAEDQSTLDYTFNHYKRLVPNQITGSGKMNWEYGRTTGLSYSAFGINAILQTCEIARHQGVDLYHWKAEDGRGSIEKALDNLTPYVLKPSSWRHKQIRAFVGESATPWEMGYLVFGKPEYLSVVKKYGRPMYGSCTAGPVTLTHARGAYTWQVVKPAVNEK